MFPEERFVELLIIAVLNLGDNLSMLISSGIIMLVSQIHSQASVNFIGLAVLASVLIFFLNMPLREKSA